MLNELSNATDLSSNYLNYLKGAPSNHIRQKNKENPYK